MTFSKYRKELRGVQTFVFTLPVISTGFNPHALTFPPMGDNSGLYISFAMAIAGTSACLPYFLLPKPRKGLVLCILFVLFVVSGCVSLWLNASYVVPIPRAGASPQLVIRGTLRNPDLRPNYANMSDEKLIENAGQTDAALELAYTSSSLLANRMKVFGAYVAALVLLELFLGSCAVERKEPNPQLVNP